MRLVDAGDLTYKLGQFFEGKKTLGQIINEQPTAYGIDKVIEELEDTKGNLLSTINDYINGRIVLSDRAIYILIKDNFDEAIEIVRRGGIK